MFKKLKLDSGLIIREFNDVIEYAILILLAGFAILTIINAIDAVIIVRPLIGSVSFDNILTHAKIFRFLTALRVMTHSGKVIAVQIVMIRLFSMLVMEIALLSVVAGLFAIRKVLKYLSVANRAALLAKTGRAGAPEIDNGIVTGQLSSGRAVIHN